MKNIKLLLLIMFIVLTLTGCDMVGEIIEFVNLSHKEKPDYTSESGRNWHDQGTYERDNILEALSKGDIQEIKNLLCREIQKIEDIEEQLQILVDYFHGEVISHDNGTISKGSASSEGGVWVDLSMHEIVKSIITDGDDVYDLFINSIYANKESTNLIGVYRIRLTNIKDNTLCAFDPLKVNIKEDYDGDYLPDELEKQIGTNYNKKYSNGDGIPDWLAFIPEELQEELGIRQGIRSDSNNDGISDIEDYIAYYQNRDVYVMEVIDCYHTGKEFGTLYMPLDVNEDGILDDEEYENMLQETKND